MPGDALSNPNPEQIFLDKLPLIEKVILSICRRHRCFGADAEDFSSTVKLKLVDDDYAVLRQFRGTSRLSTFLTTVVANQFRDFRNHKWGKWRPSAKAKKLGTVAVQLEELQVRDSYSFDEAVELLKTRLGDDAPPPEEISAVAEQLPVRVQRRFEGEEGLESLPAREQADERMLREEREAQLEKAKAALAEALRKLPAEDRLILKMHYEDGFTIALIHRQLGIPQRRLYSRLEQLRKQLKQTLGDAGVARDIAQILVWD